MKIKDPQKCLYDCLFKCLSNILRNGYGQGPRTQNQTYFTLLHLHSGLVENIVAQSLKTLIYVAKGPIFISFSELGLRQFCRDNVTMFSGYTVVIYCNITVIVWLLHLDDTCI